MLKLVHEVAWQFAKKLLHEVVWQFNTSACSCGLMFDRSFLQLLLGHYSVRFGYQREQNNTAIVLKHVFQSNFCTLQNT